MMKKKIKVYSIKTCTLISAFIIVSGCSTINETEKEQNQIVHLQKQRIRNLEGELKKRDRLISDLKAQDWAKKPSRVDEKLAFQKLRSLYKDRKWAAALQESSRLKQDYADSIRLRTYRYKIFRKLGLESQAAHEQMALKKILAKNKRQKGESSL